MTAPGTLLDGRFEVLEPIADQGHGETWKARDTQMRNRLVALKLVGAPGGAEVDATGRRLKAFRHGAVLAVLHHGVADGRAYLAHELFEAPSLATVLAQSWRDDAPLPRATLERLAEKLCEALDAAHAQSPPLVHGSLRAECVLLQRASAQGVELRVADFGHASIAQKPLASGTEGVRADVVALGAVLRAAFAAQAAPGRGPAPTGQDWRRDDLPDEVWYVVERAMAPRPDDRFASVESLQSALEAAWSAPVRGPAVRPVVPVATAPAEVRRSATEIAPRRPMAPPAEPPAMATTPEEAPATEFVPRRPAVPSAQAPVIAAAPEEAPATEFVPRRPAAPPVRAPAAAPPSAGDQTALLSSAWGEEVIASPAGASTRASAQPAGPISVASSDAEFRTRAPKGGVTREVGVQTVAASALEIQRAEQNVPDPVIQRTEFVVGLSTSAAPPAPMPARMEAVAPRSSSRGLVIAGAVLAALVVLVVLVAALW